MIDRKEIIEQCKNAINSGKPITDYNFYHDVIMFFMTNKIAEPPATPFLDYSKLEWRCGGCGAVVGWQEICPGGLEDEKHRYCPDCGRRVDWGV